MTQTSPDDGAETTILSEPQLHSATDSPTVLLRNEDDTDHALDVRIADGEAVLTEGRHTVAGDSQHAIAATTDVELLRVDLRADHGGAASLTVDLGRSNRVPEFVVRRDTIVVAGLN